MGVAVEERLAVALGPLASAVGELACRRRARTAACAGPRSRTIAACRRRRARPSPAAAGRPAAWRARPRSRRASIRRWCGGSGRGGGRRALAAGPAPSTGIVERRRGRGRPAKVVGVARPRPAPRRPRSASRASMPPRRSCGAPSSVHGRGKGLAQGGVHLGRGLARAGTPRPGEVAADLVGVQVALGEQVAHAGQRQLPAVGGRAQELLQHRQAARACSPVVGRPTSLDPAEQRGDVVDSRRCAPARRGSRCRGCCRG